MTAKPSTNLFSEARQDPIDLPTPERVLTVGAHPDDAEFGAGGTLAKWAAEGCEISMLIVTDGSKGTWDEHQDPAHLIAARRSEQRAAAEALGARGDIVFGDFVDGELENNRELQRLIALWVRRVKPDVVMTFDPWKKYMLHPDHRAIGWGVIDGIVAARDHLFFPDQLVDGLTKHRPQAILLFAAQNAKELSRRLFALLFGIPPNVDFVIVTARVLDDVCHRQRRRHFLLSSLDLFLKLMTAFEREDGLSAQVGPFDVTL